MTVLCSGVGATPKHQYTPARSRLLSRPPKHFSITCSTTRFDRVHAESKDNPTTPGPAPFWPTRVRVQHDSYIRANRAAVWQLMQDVTSAEQWAGVSVVLATLESIYGVEYQGLAEQLLTAFQEANLTPGSANPPAASSSTRLANSSSSSSTDTDQQRERQYEHLGPSVLGLNVQAIAALRRRRRKSRSSSPESSVDDSTDHTQQQQQQQQQQEELHDSGSSPSNSGTRISGSPSAAAAAAVDNVDEEEQEAAAAADALFMQLLLLLAQRAGFVSLCERDIQLSVSLNTDFLWQLFVKANTEQLDEQFIANNVEAFSHSAAGSNGSTAAATAQMPDKIQSLLVLRRGYSFEKQRGRWLLQKLDYLQLLLVKRLFLGVTSLGSAAWQQVVAVSKVLQGMKDDQRDLAAAVEAEQSPSADVSQQQQGQQDQQQHVDQLTGVAAAAAAVADRQQSNSSRRPQRQQPKQRPRGPVTDAFGRLYLYSDSDPPEQEPKQQQQWQEAITAVRAAAPDSTRTSSKGRHASKQPDTASSSNGKASPFKQQRQQWRRQLVARRRQLQQKQQRQQQRMLADLRSNVQDRLAAIAHTLSDWGIIPRMDVIPLERFDEVFPLEEPSRLKPLYIEKATLPDIMDPVIEPRLKWLVTKSLPQPLHNPTEGLLTPWEGLHNPSQGVLPPKAVSSPTALTAADGSSCSSLESYDAWDVQAATAAAADGVGSSSKPVAGGSVGLFDALLQPVEIVEPTFRQLLVVYRKKPRQDRWRELRERITGKKSLQKPKRRSAIQLQVYRDIPLPSWQVVFPDKLLQFRPLDLIRLDIFGVAGIGAALAQAKYTSIILQLLTLASLSVWIFRITLGYLRMGDRYKSIIAQLLAERTVAGGEGGLEYLATAAGLQQFKQAALAYVLLVMSQRAMSVDDVAAAAEQLLEDKLKLQVCFNAEEALQELQRFGLLIVEQQQQVALHHVGAIAADAAGHRAADAHSNNLVTFTAARSVPVNGTKQQQQQPESPGVVTAVLEGQQQEQQLYRVLSSDAAQQVLQQYWAGLLQQRVNSILRDV